jgi:hypothetical protein
MLILLFSRQKLKMGPLHLQLRKQHLILKYDLKNGSPVLGTICRYLGKETSSN